MGRHKYNKSLRQALDKSTILKKKIKVKRVWAMAYVVEHLPCNHEALSSNSITTKKITKDINHRRAPRFTKNSKIHIEAQKT
jgi:hypothetical protein